MKVLICGASGVIGRYLVPILVRHGHQVTALARSDQAAALAGTLGATPVAGDLLRRETLSEAARGQDAIIHAATTIPKTFPARPADFAMNDRIRREGTANLLYAAHETGVRRLVVESISWVHGDVHGAWIDEDAPLQATRLTRSAVDMEMQVKEYARRTSAQVRILRCSSLYAAEAWHTAEIIDRLKKRLAPVIGNGDNYQCFVHAEDVATAFAAALESDAAGDTFFVTDDEPVRLGEYLRWLAKQSGAPEPLRLPHFVARLALGHDMFDAYTASLRCRNDRMKQLGWKPRFGNFRDGYAEVLPRLYSSCGA